MLAGKQLVLIWSLVIFALWISQSFAASQRPNILLILADDMGADASSLYPSLEGDLAQVSTPTLESLAASGVVFENAWANPACSATRGTIISGMYGHNNGIVNVGEYLPGGTTSLFEYIAASSPETYAMGAFGKWHIGNTIEHVTNDTGVPEFRGFLGLAISNYYNWSLDSTGTDDGDTITTYATTALTDYAIEFIRNHEESIQANEPWFVYLSYNAPHGTNASDGYQVPPADLFSVDVGGLTPGPDNQTSYYGNISVYQAMIQAMDTEINRLLDSIGPPGSAERNNTLIIFLGDNGTPGAVQIANSGNRGNKGAVYEGGVHVPMIIAGAGVTRQGERDSNLVVSSDLYATIAEFSGIPVSQIYNSYSLAPLLRDDSASSGRQYSFTEHCGYNSKYAIRDDRYKLLYSSGFELYDLQSDPLEQNNLYNDSSVAAEQILLEAEHVRLQELASGGCFQPLPIDPDTDGDGTPDGQDAFPLDPTESVGSDNDGITNAQEFLFNLDPSNPGDAAQGGDADTINNRTEITAGTNARNAAEPPPPGDANGSSLDLYSLSFLAFYVLERRRRRPLSRARGK